VVSNIGQASHPLKTMVTCKIKHLQNICKNVLEVVTCKIKHYIHGITAGVDGSKNIFANVLFYM